jgi:hypothetical protein
MALRSHGLAAPSGCRPDMETISFLHELGQISAAGCDIRARIFA